MGIDSGRPFPKSKLLRLRGGGKGKGLYQEVPRASGNGAQKEQRAQEGLPRPLLPHGVSSSDFEKESLHWNSFPLSSERMSGVPQEGASHGLCDETHSGLTLIL